MSSAINQQDTLLRVEHLCQYFGPTKAVDDVSFDIKRGEVFGLVGESGCGKTTTGRSIIKIYDITSGSIYFEGQRICAGTRSYVEAIKAAKAEMKTASPERKAELQAVIAENKNQIHLAKYDHKHSDHQYVETLVAQLNAEYAENLKKAKTPEETEALKKKYREDLRIAKKTKLITKIQMIFQDPVASLNPRMTVKEIISEGLIINGIRDKEYLWGLPASMPVATRMNSPAARSSASASRARSSCIPTC